MFQSVKTGVNHPRTAGGAQPWHDVDDVRVIAGRTETGVGNAAANISRAIVAVKEAGALAQCVDELTVIVRGIVGPPSAGRSDHHGRLRATGNRQAVSTQTPDQRR